ncbi:MAG: hypothetical protein WEB55_06045 [Acidimicrobiia bacterium]
MNTNRDIPGCSHAIVPVTRDIGIDACGACGTIDWFRRGAPIPAFDGMAEVFGMFDLVATLPGVSSPGPEVMLYKAPRGASRSLLDALPRRTWLEAAPGIAVSHDGRHLLVSPVEPVLEGRPS